ncbi:MULTISPECIES: hypothetical protein [unclassified Rhodococcus (in: high G+C Gram-positive bacteria)]|uniref:hypothetical protein n=1 Tax=unclassified Rhodococcus (in: high G+C Gram-positive bacteria) TaxID=192944 RepID=UPI001C9A6D35|nr:MULTISPECIES: hypothetical protein [unclassified Rhodococcus (in: high G+C Gram-positive bacteria)]MBY6709128.1 hypothetical protein [Rhodococcus sp. BP-241]
MPTSNRADDEWFPPLSAHPTAESDVAAMDPVVDHSDEHTGHVAVMTPPDQRTDDHLAPWQAVLAELPTATAPVNVPAAPLASEAGWVRRHRSSLAVAVSAAALVAVAGGAAWAVLPSVTDDAPAPSLAQELVATTEAVTTTSTAPTPTTPAVLPFEQWCAQQPGGEVASADSADPNLAAIARIEDAYYRSRDVGAASAQLADGIDLDPAAFAAAVAAIPAGTEHCVLADERAPSQFRVTVIERRPGGEQKRFVSSMTTAPAATGDTAVIAAIGPAS